MNPHHFLKKHHNRCTLLFTFDLHQNLGQEFCISYRHIASLTYVRISDRNSASLTYSYTVHLCLTAESLTGTLTDTLHPSETQYQCTLCLDSERLSLLQFVTIKNTKSPLSKNTGSIQTFSKY